MCWCIDYRCRLWASDEVDSSKGAFNIAVPASALPLNCHMPPQVVAECASDEFYMAPKVVVRFCHAPIPRRYFLD